MYSGISLQVVPAFSLVQEMFEVQVRFSPACFQELTGKNIIFCLSVCLPVCMFLLCEGKMKFMDGRKCQ